MHIAIALKAKKKLLPSLITLNKEFLKTRDVSLSKTKNIATTGEMLGHSKKNGYKSTLRYAQVLQEDVDKAWDVIDGPDEKEETKVVKLTK